MRCLWMIATIMSLSVSSFGLSYAAPSADTFSQAQRAEIVRITREALKADPSILSDAIMSLRSKAEADQRSKAANSLETAKDELESAPDYAIKGNRHGDVTIVEFFDPRCGYCKRDIAVVDDVLKRDTKIRFIEKIVPVLSDKSMIETRAIFAAARQGGYDKMKRALMSANVSPTDEHLRDVAKRVGLNPEQLIKDMSDKQVLSEIKTNLNQARNLDLSGTPTFIFNHKVAIPGYMSADDILREVAAIRKM